MGLWRLQFAESSFDVVVDKGSLDALTGEPEEPLTAAKSLLSEVFVSDYFTDCVMSVGRWCSLFRELFAGKKKPCSSCLQLCSNLFLVD
jgi:hypothetical protein